MKTPIHRRVIRYLYGLSCRLTYLKLAFGSFNVTGTENLKGLGQRIYVSNHTSHVDALIMVARVPGLFWIAAEPVAAAHWAGRIIVYLCLGFPVKAAWGLRTILKYLKAGESVVIFAEGSVNYSPDEELRELKKGWYLSARTYLEKSGVDVSIVPLFIHYEKRPNFPVGVRDLLNPWTVRKNWRNVTVAIGEPMATSKFGDDPEAASENLRRKLILLRDRCRK